MEQDKTPWIQGAGLYASGYTGSRAADPTGRRLVEQTGQDGVVDHISAPDTQRGVRTRDAENRLALGPR